MIRHHFFRRLLAPAAALLAPGLIRLCPAAAPTSRPADPQPPAVVELLDENTATLLATLTNPGGMPGEGRVESDIVFSGKTSLKIIPLQRYGPNIPGWNFRIREKPAPGEYRYVRFAWKSDGARGMMFQLLCERDWLRYQAGGTDYPWPAKLISPDPPKTWQLVTRDMFKDFGDSTITGFGPTVFGGTAGYFDHAYLARTTDDLDRIDATGITAHPPKLTPEDLDRLWGQLTGKDDAAAYLAFWTLVATPEASAPFIKEKLASVDPRVEQIRRWIAQLDSPDWRTRASASQKLAENLAIAMTQLQRTLADNPSPETRTRIEAILRSRHAADAPPDRPGAAIRMLQYMDGEAGRDALRELARGAEGSRIADAAKAALQAPRPVIYRPAESR